MSYVSYVLTVLFVIGLAYFTTQYLSITYRNGQSKRRIKVIEKINLAADKHLWLIELGSKYYFMYSDRKGLTQIDCIDELPELPEITNVTPLSTFQEILQKKGQTKDDK